MKRDATWGEKIRAVRKMSRAQLAGLACGIVTAPLQKPMTTDEATKLLAISELARRDFEEAVEKLPGAAQPAKERAS